MSTSEKSKTETTPNTPQSGKGISRTGTPLQISTTKPITKSNAYPSPESVMRNGLFHQIPSADSPLTIEEGRKRALERLLGNSSPTRETNDENQNSPTYNPNLTSHFSMESDFARDSGGLNEWEWNLASPVDPQRLSANLTREEYLSKTMARLENDTGKGTAPL